MKRSRAAIGIATLTTAVTSAALLGAAPASAGPAEKPTVSDPVVSGLAGPLQMDIDDRNTVPRAFVGESFLGRLTLVRMDGTTKVLHEETNAEVAGVALNGDEVGFLTTKHSHKHPGSFLKILDQDADATKLANLYAYEAQANPDESNRYGFQKLGQQCKTELASSAGAGQLPYDGIVESHPYGLAKSPKGGAWFVADAAANAILKVGRNGAVTTVAVLPAQEMVVTSDQATAMGWPSCVAGKTLAAEPVPTDVEVDRDGNLIVSLLPGADEEGALGARGSVVQINPGTGKVKVLATGFGMATNVAVRGATIFVSELSGQVSKILQDTEVVKVVDVPTPGALEWGAHQLWATIDLFNQQDGASLVAINP